MFPMFEWKSPDPRLVALVRRLEAALLRRFPGYGKSGSTSDEVIDERERSNEGHRDESATCDGDPPTT